MKKWLKRIGIAVLVVLVLGLLFHKQILATAGYIFATQQIQKHNAAEVVPVAHSLATSTFPVISEITVDTVRMPILFEETDSQISTSSHVVRGEERAVFFWSNPIKLRDSVLPNEKYEQSEYDAMCDAFSQAGRTDACSSEFAFLKTQLSTTPEQTHWFSSTNEKVGFSILGILKTVYLTGRTSDIQEFSTQSVRGFIFDSEEDISVVVFFLPNDEAYEIIFTGYTAEEIDFTLANIEVVE